MHYIKEHWMKMRLVCYLEVIVVLLHNEFSLLNGEEITCPIGWEIFDANSCCYNFVQKDSVSYPEANDACLEEGAFLASVHSQSENDFITSKTQDVATKHVWLGGRANRDAGRVWEWDDGSTFDYSNWSPGEPNDWHSIEENLQLEITDSMGSNRIGKWNDAPGTSYLYHLGGYVCKKCFSSEFCPPGWVDFDTSCYVTSSAVVDAETAESNCTEIGGHLVSVGSELEQKFVAKQAEALIKFGSGNERAVTPLQKQCKTGWDSFQGCCYKIEDGTGVSYDKATEICDDIGGSLVSIHSHEENNFIFNLAKRSLPAATRAIIGYKTANYLNRSIQSLRGDEFLSVRSDFHLGHWTPEDGSPNDFSFWDPFNKALSLDQLRRYNRGNYSTDLAPMAMRLTGPTETLKTWSIKGPRSSAEAVACETCLTNGGVAPEQNLYVWTGGMEKVKGTGLPSTWKWIDGTDFNYADWGPGLPSLPTGVNPEPRCIALSKSYEYKWNPVDCQTNRAKFVCEKPKEYKHYKAVMQRLRAKLSKNFPLSNFNATSIRITNFNMGQFLDINENDASITVSGYYWMDWKNPSFKWNASFGEFKGIDIVHIFPNHQLETPKLFFPTSTLGAEAVVDSFGAVRIFSNGKMDQIVSFRIRVNCNDSSMNYPFDSMECTIPFGPPPGSDPRFGLKLTKVDDSLWIMNGRIALGWRFSNAKNNLIDGSVPRAAEGFDSKAPFDINCNNGYFVLTFTLTRVYQYHAILVGEIVFAMSLILCTLWICDICAASGLLLISLMTCGFYLNDLSANINTPINMIPAFAVVYGVTVGTSAAVFVLLVFINKCCRIRQNFVVSNKTAADTSNAIFNHLTNAKDVSLAENRNTISSALIKETIDDPMIKLSIFIKRIVFCILMLLFTILLCWFLF